MTFLLAIPIFGLGLIVGGLWAMETLDARSLRFRLKLQTVILVAVGAMLVFAGQAIIAKAHAAKLPSICAQYQHGVIPHPASNADRVRAWKCDIWRRTAPDNREWAAQREEWRKQELELGR